MWPGPPWRAEHPVLSDQAGVSKLRKADKGAARDSSPMPASPPRSLQDRVQGRVKDGGQGEVLQKY